MIWQQKHQKEKASEMVQTRNDESHNYIMALRMEANALSETDLIKFWKLSGRRERRKNGSVMTSLAEVGLRNLEQVWGGKT